MLRVHQLRVLACFIISLLLHSVAQAIDEHDFDYYGGLTYDDAVPSPADYLGYEIGEHFTRHADLVNYLSHIAELSDRVEIEQYGQTHQRRPLHLLTVSSPENLTNLDEILARNLELCDPETTDERAQEIIDTNPALVWFSYNVHGNEPSPAETAIALTYTLAAATNAEVRDLLDNVIVFIDPMLNADGHARYVNWYQTVLGMNPNADPNAAEHNEPWPGGRTNHYYFDLNRDWVWLVQVESQHRIKAYTRVRPHLHVDFHEQGYRSPFFFGAGDDPYNVNIPAETRTWVEKYGQANAKDFDREGLVYATKERFDYLYPGYGKVLPVYHGAVGMLAEKGGHSRAGLAIEVGEHYTLTLRERTYHHWLLSMSNLQATHVNRRGQLERFRKFFVDSAHAEAHPIKAFVISPGNDPALLQRVWTICNEHGIEIETAAEHGSIDAHDFGSGEKVKVDVPAGTWIVRTDQAMGRLALALFERDPVVTDPDTYDLTSWSLPLAFGLDAWYAKSPVTLRSETLETFAPRAASISAGDPNHAVALVVDASQYAFPQAMGLAAAHELFCRVAGEPITVDGRRFSAGSLIIHHVRNAPGALDAFADDLASLGLDAHRASTGMTADGPVLGANANAIADVPTVLLLRDESLSSYSFGQHWHLLDVAQPIPHTVVTASSLASAMNDANVLVLADGNPAGAISNAQVGALKRWVQSGGVVVASGSSASWASRTLLDLEMPDEADDDRPTRSEISYEQGRDRSVEDRIPGTNVRIDVDTTHPLAAGLRAWYGIIKRGDRVLPVADGGSVIARIDPDQPLIGGLMSDRNQQRLAGQPWMTQHSVGRGSVICIADDITLRGFQYGPLRMLMNAITLGPSS